MMLLAIDPGEKTSGVVLFDRDKWRVIESRNSPNEHLAIVIAAGYMIGADDVTRYEFESVVCEKPMPMGQPLSGNLVETTLWCGAFWWAAMFCTPWHWITRNQVKVAICGRCKGIKDAHVLTGVQERFGGREKCKGTKKQPGPCYGVSSHAWQALAACVAWIEMDLPY